MQHYMNQALTAAKQIAQGGLEVPVAAIIVDHRTQQVIAQSTNLVETQKDVTSHAEINALKQACLHVGDKFLTHCDIYVTLEPCPMCAAALSYARIRRIYFGAYDIKSGGIDNGPRIYTSDALHHKPEVIGGLMEQECGQIIKDFFSTLR